MEDVVIVVDESTPHSQWPMARVVKTFPDAGGLVRSAVVRGKFGNLRDLLQKCVLLFQQRFGPLLLFVSLQSELFLRDHSLLVVL